MVDEVVGNGIAKHAMSEDSFRFKAQGVPGCTVACDTQFN